VKDSSTYKISAEVVKPFLELATQWRPISVVCTYMPLVGPGEGKGVACLLTYPDVALKPSASSGAVTMNGGVPKAVHIKQSHQTGGFSNEWLSTDEDSEGGYMLYLSNKSTTDIGWIKVQLTIRLRGSK